jgi:hypothetical protein
LAAAGRRARTPTDPALDAFLDGFSIEVMPRTAEKVDDFRAILPAGTRVYIAHIAGTPIGDMVATAARLRAEGMAPMPHFPARIIADTAELGDWIARYQGEAGVDQGLILAGGVHAPAGDFDSSMALLDTGLFDKAGLSAAACRRPPRGQQRHRRRWRAPRGRCRACLETGLCRTDRCRDGDRHPVRLRGRPGDRLGRPAARPGHHPARPHRRGGAGQAADADQIRHRLRRRAVAAGAAAPRRAM